jgi:hypothetical protein
MKKSYKLVQNGLTSIIEMTEEDGTMRFVPIAEDNSDYQRYLRWLENPDAEEGGTL